MNLRKIRMREAENIAALVQAQEEELDKIEVAATVSSRIKTEMFYT